MVDSSGAIAAAHKIWSQWLAAHGHEPTTLEDFTNGFTFKQGRLAIEGAGTVHGLFDGKQVMIGPFAVIVQEGRVGDMWSVPE